MKNLIIALVIVGVAVGGFFVYRNMSSGADETPETTTIPQDAPIETTTAEGSDVPDSTDVTQVNEGGSEAGEESEPAFVMPTIDESDDYLRSHLQGRDAVINEVLERDDLIRKSVAAVDLSDREKNPIRLVTFLAPEGRMVVEKRGEKLYLSPKNYERYQPLIHAIESVDASFMGTTYQRLQPLFEEAYNELGNENPNWNGTLEETLREVAALEVPSGDIEVSGSGKVFIYADPKLEKLPPLQKLLIRMGPENALKVQNRIRELLPYLK